MANAFQSTPSIRRATGEGQGGARRRGISIHALHTEGDVRPQPLRRRDVISIHALHTEGDRGPGRARGGRAISIHALHTEGDMMSMVITSLRRDFNPRPPYGGRRPWTRRWRSSRPDFNPRPPYGGRPASSAASPAPVKFQSTPSIRRATDDHPADDGGDEFQSTPSIRRATQARVRPFGHRLISIHALHTEGDGLRAGRGQRVRISIHALHTEGDRFSGWPTAYTSNFNPRPPYGGRHDDPAFVPCVMFDFNPRPPYGGRRPRGYGRDRTWDFNPRPPYGGRPPPRAATTTGTNFNPRPPYGGRRRRSPAGAPRALSFQSTPSIRRATAISGSMSGVAGFQSTPSIRRATRSNTKLRSRTYISIHALHTEGDLWGVELSKSQVKFQSTPSIRRATVAGLAEHAAGLAISIHALHTEGDEGARGPRGGPIVFQSTPSIRRATHNLRRILRQELAFQSTPSIRRATPRRRRIPETVDFNPRPPYGGRRIERDRAVAVDAFQSTPSIRRATSFTSTITLVVVFQSTPSIRRATPGAGGRAAVVSISIHALHTEGDPRASS